jgi:hypothetical protein
MSGNLNFWTIAAISIIAIIVGVITTGLLS